MNQDREGSDSVALLQGITERKEREQLLEKRDGLVRREAQDYIRVGDGIRRVNCAGEILPKHTD